MIVVDSLAGPADPIGARFVLSFRRQFFFVAIFCLVSGLTAAQNRSASPHGPLAIACQNCHTTTSFTPLRAQIEFNHNTETQFPLRGQHTSVACTSCHVSKVFAQASTRCADCHADFHRRQFGAQCDSCHTVQGWRVNVRPLQDHWNRFPLLGAHAALQCVSCHPGAAVGNYVGQSTQCVSCHRTQFNQSATVNHTAAGFPTTCETCHTADQWRVQRFDHVRFGKFELAGAHQTLSCSQCHIGGRFQGTATDCASCHVNDFNRAKSPNHLASGFSRDCASCHTSLTWQGAKFDHNTTRFPLTGKHTSTTCAQCHVNGQFNGLASTCESCHLKDFQAAKNPNHVTSGFSQNCQSCHTTAQWQGAKFDHNTTRFPLTGKHIAVTCTQCHVNGQYAALATACESCHLKDYQATKNPNHASSGFPQNCQLCHTTAQWQGAKFDHNTTRFPLTGKHTTTNCAQCHTNGQYTGLAATCESCHLKDYQATKNPNHTASGFSQNCQSCHTTTQWTGAKFDHNTTKFPLTGKHTATACAQCHASGQFSALATACESCHLKDYQAAKNPNHAASGFPQNCQLCHTTAQWQGAKFDHNTTRFPLTGKHASSTCAQCHVNGQYAGLAANCASCHLKDYQTTKNPNHASAAFSQNCQVCHTTVQWQGAKFDHSATKFPLTGKHTSTTCAQCHVSGQYAGLATACESCHIKDYQAAKSPNHVSSGFPQNCVLCHTTAQWQGAKFDHNATKFPLTGKHSTTTCAQCHTGAQYAGLPTACESCHLKDYQATKTPNHVAAGFSQNCVLCHTTAQWQGAKFDHNTTKFPLTGKHTSVTCAQCHTNGQYAGLAATCESCHIKDYQAAKAPNHLSSGFPQNCVMCHTTAQWQGAKFDHNTTRFPLTGKHTTITCAQCHTNGQFAGLAATCQSCHLSAYQATRNPNHAAAGFSQNCQQCHTTSQWTGAVFDHNTTRFPLTGKHTSVTCAQCHTNGQYANLATTCESCHLRNFQATTNPNHTTAGFPQNCALCHTTAQWQGARFDHNTTRFPLTGKHTTTTCAQCHTNGQFAGLAMACQSCHLSAYQATRNPNHTAAGFSQNCQQCHTTSQWTGAVFDHNTTRFPLTGKHSAVTCAQCHTNGQYANLATTCESCHLAKYQATTAPNHVTAGFPQNCVLCHTTAQWTGATFNHSTTRFPLTGKHTAVTCAQCHTNGQYAGLPMTCESCHLAKYQATTNPNHTSAGFPRDCSLCHTTAQWTGAVFNHTATRFPLTGKHTSVACATCHVNNQYATLPTNCDSCHLPAYNSTTNPNHRTLNYPKDCALCHSTSQWTGATFNHANTRFPLTGKHTTTQCALCHVNNVYAGTPTDCYSCHTNEYNSTTNPAHATAANTNFFPKPQCSTCHTTNAWSGATFNHAQYTTFPTRHGGQQRTCVECHVNGNDYSLPSCKNCHSKNNTDGHHNGVRGYAGYDATPDLSCYNCHRNGRGG